MRRGRTHDRVILREEPVCLRVVLVALVAREGGALCHHLLERKLVAPVEVSPIAGLVLEALRVLDRGLHAREVALEVALAAGRLLGPDAAEVFHNDSTVPELAVLLPVGEAVR